MSRVTKAKRKLIPRQRLQEIEALIVVGVPLNTLIKKQDLKVSRPVVDRILRWYRTQNPVILSSIFPAWLDSAGPPIQENPEGWYYEGFFPHGEWKQE